MNPAEFLQKLDDEHPASAMVDASIFQRAAQHIRLYGWRKDEYGDAGRPCCIMGAIKVAITERLDAEQIEDDVPEYERITFSKAFDAVKTKIQKLADLSCNTVYWWNDSQESPEPVLAVLDELGRGA